MSEINCHNCEGACCVSGVAMGLKQEEAQFMRDSGTQLKVELGADPELDWSVEAPVRFKDHPDGERLIGYSKGLQKGDGYYRLVGNCGNLVLQDGWLQCKAHEDPKRPKICQEFTPGSTACQRLRILRRVDKPKPVVDMEPVDLFAWTSQRKIKFFKVFTTKK